MSDPVKTMARTAKILEDRFFYAESRVLAQRLKQLRKEEESVATLSAVSGITNKAVLKELVALNIRPETVTALVLVPVLEVAWADGTLDAEERKAVLDGLSRVSVGAQSVNQAVLQEWLSKRPNAKLLDAWKEYMRGLCEVMSKGSLNRLKSDLVGHARDVARASGGFLGLTSPISDAELTVLKEMEDFFDAPGPCCDGKR